MTRPTVGVVTERAYADLPEVYRNADEAQGTYPLLRYLSLLLDQLDPVAELLERLDYAGTTGGDKTVDVGGFSRAASADTYGADKYGSDTYGGIDSAALTDPNVADAKWLLWLAQLVGVRRDLPADQLRNILRHPEKEWAHGTPDAIADAARITLGGTQHVEIVPQFGGNPFLIGVRTIQAEALTAADSWKALETAAPTWAKLAALGTFGGARGPSVVAAAERERPAGYRLVPDYVPPDVVVVD